MLGDKCDRSIDTPILPCSHQIASRLIGLAGQQLSPGSGNTSGLSCDGPDHPRIHFYSSL